MTFTLYDRIWEHTTSTASPYSLAGAAGGTFQAFNSRLSDGQFVYFCVTDGASNWMVCGGTYSVSSNSLTVVVVLESSNSDAAVTFGAGTKDIFQVIPAQAFNNFNNSGSIQLASGSVQSWQMSSGAINSGQIANNAVNSGNVASGQIGTPHLAANSVTNTQVANGAIQSGNIGSGHIGQFHLSSGTVNSGQIGNGAVVSGSIASGQIGTIHLNFSPAVLSSGFITSGYIGNNAVNSGNISSGAVGFPHLANGAVQSGSIASGQIGQMHLSSGAVNSGQIGNNAIVSGSIASGSVGLNHLSFAPTILSSGLIASGYLGNGAVVSGSIASGQVSQNAIASGAVGPNQLASGAASQYLINGAESVSPFGTVNNNPAASPAWNLNTEETISGIYCVAVSKSGNLRIAMASVSGRMPCVGVVNGQFGSGTQAGVFTQGSLKFTSGLADYSGYLGSQLFVGRSGQIVTSSGSFNSGGLLSGDIWQSVGTAVNSGGCVVMVNPMAFKLMSG